MALPLRRSSHVLGHFRWSATWSAPMLHQLAAMLKEKTLFVGSVDSMASETAKETDLAAALIVTKTAKQLQRNQQRQLEQPRLLALLNRQHLVLPAKHLQEQLLNLTRPVAATMAAAAALVAAPTALMSSLSRAS